MTSDGEHIYHPSVPAAGKHSRYKSARGREKVESVSGPCFMVRPRWCPFPYVMVRPEGPCDGHSMVYGSARINASWLGRGSAVLFMLHD